MTTLKHKHYDMTADIVKVCENGSLKVVLTDNTAPSARLRKPKNYTITTFEKAQWEKLERPSN